uniref:1-alkyl-2-acetylglycerophosphocholine esterase n=1 Tax=Arcella intermedia TaxID=1963864 RepID=A0A6B2LB50_9EUKA
MSKREQHLPLEAAKRLISLGLPPKIPSWVSSHLALTIAHARMNVPIAGEIPKWPLLLMSHGLYGLPEVYTILAEQLASLGFIVCAPLHTDRSSCYDFVTYKPNTSVSEKDFRNKQLQLRAANISFVLDNILASDLKDFIDVDCIGACGHSFGGATSIEALKQDPRIKCSVSWDGWMFPFVDVSPVQKPILFINSDLWQWKENLEVMKIISPKLIAVRSTLHHDFDDSGHFAARTVLRAMKSIGFNDVSLVKMIIARLTAAFFAKEMKIESHSGIIGEPDFNTLLRTYKDELILSQNAF